MVAFGAIGVWVPVVCSCSRSHGVRGVPAVPIKEWYDECGNNDDAVANGLRRSGPIITSAAVLGDRNW
jgi:hypothetical protein